MSKPAFIIDKVKYDGTKVRLAFQRLRQDHKYDEAMIGSTDQPLASFRAALVDLVQDVCAIIECPVSYGDHLVVRGVTFTDSDGTRGACITALKGVKTAKSPLVLNTPHLTFWQMNDSDRGPFLPVETITRLEALEVEAIRYINGEREQSALPLAAPPADEGVQQARGIARRILDLPLAAPPADEGVIARARRMGEDLGQAITDPNNPIVQKFAKRMKSCSISVGGRRLNIDSHGGITAGPDHDQKPQGEL